MAEYVLKNFDIKKILFIPAYIPTQKNSDPKMAYHRPVSYTHLNTWKNSSLITGAGRKSLAPERIALTIKSTDGLSDICLLYTSRCV